MVSLDAYREALRSKFDSIDEGFAETLPPINTALADLATADVALDARLDTLEAGVPVVFTSAEQTITSAGTITVTHGLGVVPDLVETYAICKTAEQGFAVGDLVRVEFTGSSTTVTRANSIWADNTSLRVRYSDVTNCFTMANKTTGAFIGLTNANWRLILKAVKI